MSRLILPPLLTAFEAVDPFTFAVDRVQKRKAGAGDLFWAPETKTTADFSIILEPETSHDRALEMIPLAMVALSDCLAVLLPPQVAVQFRQDTNITVNGGIAGKVKAGFAESGISGSPDWLVLSIKVDLNHDEGLGDPGQQPEITTLDEEGWENPDVVKFIETYARHFLSWMAAWDDEGFNAVARAWKFKAEDGTEPDLALMSNNISIFESIA